MIKSLSGIRFNIPLRQQLAQIGQFQCEAVRQDQMSQVDNWQLCFIKYVGIRCSDDATAPPDQDSIGILIDLCIPGYQFCLQGFPEFTRQLGTVRNGFIKQELDIGRSLLFQEANRQLYGPREYRVLMKLSVYFTGIPQKPVIADKDHPAKQVIGDGEKDIICIDTDGLGINFTDCFF